MAPWQRTLLPDMTALRRLRLSLALLVALVALGTLGYVTIEGYPLLDALYMTVITLATVGFNEVHLLHSAGRLFTIVLIVVGLGVVSAAVGSALEMLFGTQLRDVIGRQRMERHLETMKDHSIVVAVSCLVAVLLSISLPPR